MKNMSLAARQSLLSILFGFLPFALILLSAYSYISGLSGKEQVSSRYYSIQSVATALDYTVSNFDEMSLYIIGSDPIRDFLSCAQPVDSPEYLRVSSSASKAMALLPFTSSAGQTCGVFSMDGRKISRGVNDQIAITEAEKRRCEALKGKWFWSIDGDCLAMCRLLRDKVQVSHLLGYIKILVRVDTLLPLFAVPKELNGSNYTDYTFILYDYDLGGVLLANASPESYAWLWEQLDMEAARREEVGDFHVRNGTAPYSVMSRRLSGCQSVLITLIPDSAAHYRQLKLSMMGMALLLSVLMILIQILIFRQLVVRPLKKLGSLMASVENEDFEVSFHNRGRDEISRLAARFNSMAQRLEQLHNQVYQEQLSMRAAEIKILEKEINPHFLFNTLNSIYWTIQVRDTAVAGQMVQDLSNLFRLSLQRSSDDLIPLAAELEHMRCYLSLEHMRLGSSLEYTVDVQPGLEQAMVIKLVLQPLVENAIVHGILPNEGGELSVSVYTDGDQLCYMIYDNGVGADPDEIRRILSTPEKVGSSHGIALRNVHERIMLKFGSRYGVSYSRPADGGSVFPVRQPLWQQGQADALDSPQGGTA